MLNSIQKKLFKNLSFFLATGFGSGLSPKAPGTVGSAVCLILWYLNMRFTRIPDFILLLLVTNIGYLATEYYLKCLHETDSSITDPSYIVIDEWAGILIPLSCCQYFTEFYWIIAAFILFRFFDISKWWLVGKAESLPRGLGIMADDLVAGIFSAVVMILLNICILIPNILANILQ